MCVYSLGWAIMGRMKKGSTNGMPVQMWGCGYLRPHRFSQEPSVLSTSTQMLGLPGMLMLANFTFIAIRVFQKSFCFLFVSINFLLISVFFPPFFLGTGMCLRGWGFWVTSCYLKCSHCYSWRSGMACTQGTSSASPWSSSLSMWRDR